MADTSTPVTQSVLVVDDDAVLRRLVSEDLPTHGFEVIPAASLQEARQLLNEKPVQAIVLDYRLPDGTGGDFFRSIRESYGSMPVVFVTNFPDVEQAVQLMKEGAADYFIKPFSIADLARRLRQLIEAERLRAEVSYHRRRSLPTNGKYELVGGSAAMKTVRQSIAEASRSPNTPVLITGETGTGKEVVARLIHQTTCGDSQPWVEVDCTAIPKGLFESELFGHERGAFTGAEQAKEGLLELGKKGTLFLDEIGELELDLQVRLLRTLETHQFRRVGGTRPLFFGARVIAATNRDLDQLLNQKIFRADLYYRLAVYKIHLSPLRERREDIPELAEHFLREAAQRHGKSVRRLARSFFKKLEFHSFPGNVRELRNLVEQAVIQSNGEEADFDERLPLASKVPSVSETPAESEDVTLSDHERNLIEAALKRNRGNKSAAARQLGISRPALLRRLAKMKGSSPGGKDGG
jgi:two-component system response regulator AtoC